MKIKYSTIIFCGSGIAFLVIWCVIYLYFPEHRVLAIEVISSFIAFFGVYITVYFSQEKYYRTLREQARPFFLFDYLSYSAEDIKNILENKYRVTNEEEFSELLYIKKEIKKQEYEFDKDIIETKKYFSQIEDDDVYEDSKENYDFAVTNNDKSISDIKLIKNDCINIIIKGKEAIFEDKETFENVTMHLYKKFNGEYLRVPFRITNVGNNVSINTMVILYENDKVIKRVCFYQINKNSSFYIYFFVCDMNSVEKEYKLVIRYLDIQGQEYRQKYGLHAGRNKEKGNNYLNIDLEGKQSIEF